jgi:Arc/MetJ-type ribon-helix-helix transcriptional regulator
MKDKTKIVAARVTEATLEILNEYCSRNAHINISDFIRDAIREKIQRDAPQLYMRLFKEAWE